MLTGELSKPQGEGRFGSVVLLHGCSGLEVWGDMWAERLTSWGYVTLQVDSLGPRGESGVCDDVRRVPPSLRAKDSHAAKSYLEGLPFVNPNRIAVLGASHGGWTVLDAVQTGTNPFQVAIALYPWCPLYVIRLDTPLLILIGELDDWCSAKRCRTLEENWSEGLPGPGGKEPEIILKVYPDAYHGFDREGRNMKYMGHRIEYDPAAAADAIVQVKGFLARYLQ